MKDSEAEVAKTDKPKTLKRKAPGKKAQTEASGYETQTAAEDVVNLAVHLQKHDVDRRPGQVKCTCCGRIHQKTAKEIEAEKKPILLRKDPK